jgi:hypothetical protein
MSLGHAAENAKKAGQDRSLCFVRIRASSVDVAGPKNVMVLNSSAAPSRFHGRIWLKWVDAGKASFSRNNR